MILSSSNRKLFDNIKRCARISIKKCKNKKQWERGVDYLKDHYLFDLPLYRNLKIINYLEKNIPKNSRILDWGCGYGDISYLLSNKRSDIKIKLYDIFWSSPWKILIDKANLEKDFSRQQRKIPYNDNSFDSVIGVGVLEHVDDQKFSLQEIHRILKPKGQFFIFLYPNSYSYTETFQKLIGNPYHKNTLKMLELKKILLDSGFIIEKQEYNFLLPFMLSRFPSSIRYAYNLFGNLIVIANNILEKIPFIKRVSSNITIVCYKK
ncbi:class I SAM-dependent methyltransferase [Candidatus Parcubacteria bacterium]|nr:class I SAM-dependent methyltransferase [Candidatus Parcubacteria bacterium]